MILNTPFTDWLDVTYAPDDVPEPELRVFLLGLGFTVDYDNKRKMRYSPPGERGLLQLHEAARFGRISASGAICSWLQRHGHWSDFLAILSSCPHKVTRIDVAMDVLADGADVIASLQTRYPDGYVSLGRKASKVTQMLKQRDSDNRFTGTYYVGYRSSARATARVYDKRFERLENAGTDIGMDVTRYEVTARKDYGVTLRDAYEPASLFWHIASPALILTKPKGVDMWVSHGDFVGWHHQPKLRTAYEVLCDRVEWSAELEALIALADDVSPDGRNLLARLFMQRLGLDATGEALPALVGS